MEHDIKNIKVRAGQIEQTLVHYSSRFDRFDQGLDRIDKRLV
jgi:hypothetical protein